MSRNELHFYFGKVHVVNSIQKFHQAQFDIDVPVEKVVPFLAK